MSPVLIKTILLVEDDPGHALLVEKNLRRANLMAELVTVANGQDALDYVFGEGRFARSTGVASRLLLILDLNLPVLDGYQVLKRIKSDERTKRIPTVILSTTEDSPEISRCYDLGCSAYITKPIDYNQFSVAVRNLGLFLAIVSVSGGD